MTIFAFMKCEWKVLFRIIFVSIVFLSIGIDANANHFIQQCNVEHSACTDDNEHNFSQNSDSASEDQIDQSFKPAFANEVSFQINLPQIRVAFDNFSQSVWQPPRVL
jgi:hypothetical protein